MLLASFPKMPKKGSIFIEIFVVGSKNAGILKQSAKWPFKVIHGR